MEFKIHRANEGDLIQRCSRQERQAQKELYDAYSQKMYTLCYRYVRNSMEAEDILVVAFTKIFERIDQFKGEGSFEGWIKRIMINEALTSLRKKRNMYIEMELDKVDYYLNYDQLNNLLEAEDLMNMIHELPSGYRVVFNMYAIDGYSHKEIAEQLGISENTSKSQLSRARIYLQKMLAQHDSSLQKFNKDESATR